MLLGINRVAISENAESMLIFGNIIMQSYVRYVVHIFQTYDPRELEQIHNVATGPYVHIATEAGFLDNSMFYFLYEGNWYTIKCALIENATNINEATDELIWDQGWNLRDLSRNPMHMINTRENVNSLISSLNPFILHQIAKIIE